MIGTLPLWTSDDAARATAGRVEGLWHATGVSIDSRTLTPGDLFLALKGPTFDGHAFAADALARGAAAAVVERRPEGVGADAPLLVVGDTFCALQDLGRVGRARSCARIAGVTGSVGKTSVKEALLLTLNRQGSTHASVGSFNNHWGVPLSLARMPAATRFGVFEMGMNHPGELTPLTLQVRPHVALITTVEAVHIQNFRSIEAIADAKAEIFAGVEVGGTAVLNRDNPSFQRLSRRAQDCGVGRILSFGSAADADLRLCAVHEDEAGATIDAEAVGSRLSYRLAIAGNHWVANSLAVLAVVHALGADVGAAARALADLRPSRGRGQRTRVSLENGSFELIDDSYNASPPSMVACFEVLGRSRPWDGGRRIAVLGDMLELGEDAPDLHAGLVRALVTNRVNLVFTAGPLMAHLHAALPSPMRAAHAADAAALAPVVAGAVRPGDVVAVKGSAGSRMRRVVEALLALHRETAAHLPKVAAGG